ncbi:hypothetical protein [Haloarcula litorea]|nr:hypothetical protein [Halomicroarcula sp. GDY20]
MTDYKHIALKPETYQALLEFQEEYFNTTSVPNGESVSALISEFQEE